ncbi:hypothetical protein J6590_024938 [Homalodisca vitripennis]|nr:hypothetical protein J6590_024938 [Homalodisca vitripennis]
MSVLLISHQHDHGDILNPFFGTFQHIIYVLYSEHIFHHSIESGHESATILQSLFHLEHDALIRVKSPCLDFIRYILKYISKFSHLTYIPQRNKPISLLSSSHIAINPVDVPSLSHANVGCVATEPIIFAGGHVIRKDKLEIGTIRGCKFADASLAVTVSPSANVSSMFSLTTVTRLSEVSDARVFIDVVLHKERVVKTSLFFYPTGRRTKLSGSSLDVFFTALLGAVGVVVESTHRAVTVDDTRPNNSVQISAARSGAAHLSHYDTGRPSPSIPPLHLSPTHVFRQPSLGRITRMGLHHTRKGGKVSIKKIALPVVDELSRFRPVYKLTRLRATGGKSCSRKLVCTDESGGLFYYTIHFPTADPQVRYAPVAIWSIKDHYNTHAAVVLLGARISPTGYSHTQPKAISEKQDVDVRRQLIANLIGQATLPLSTLMQFARGRGAGRGGGRVCPLTRFKPSPPLVVSNQLFVFIFTI